jgi:hypothetical protein
MRTHAIGVGLGAMLALGAGGFDRLATPPLAATGERVAQYCAPAQDTPDALRFFCRDEVCPAPTGAAAFACSM